MTDVSLEYKLSGDSRYRLLTRLSPRLSTRAGGRCRMLRRLPAGGGSSCCRAIGRRGGGGGGGSSSSSSSSVLLAGVRVWRFFRHPLGPQIGALQSWSWGTACSLKPLDVLVIVACTCSLQTTQIKSIRGKKYTYFIQ
jgi:hypothetical protein